MEYSEQSGNMIFSGSSPQSQSCKVLKVHLKSYIYEMWALSTLLDQVQKLQNMKYFCRIHDLALFQVAFVHRKPLHSPIL